jgi:predicted enzyme related to lactoylglutathione lyase
MYASILNITFDCADPRVQARFWGGVTGWTVHEEVILGQVQYAVGPPPQGGPRLYFVGVPEPKPAKNRIHLDLVPPQDDQARELARLKGLGATVLNTQPPGAAWVILADPEGNEFCLEG